MSNENSKINIVEGMFLFMLAGSADTVQGLGTLALSIPLIGPIFPTMAWLYGLIIWATVIFWLTMKGVSIQWFLGGGIGELIPILNALPFYTVAVIATIVQENTSVGKAVVGIAEKAKPTKL